MSVRHRPLDVRALRFSAVLTTVVLAGSILLGPTSGLALLAAQTFVFAFGAVLGMQYQPYVAVYHRFFGRRRRAALPAAENPYRFSQAVGMLVAVVALLGGVLGVYSVFYALTGAALAVSFVHAAFNYSIGTAVFHRFAQVAAHADLTEGATRRQDVTV